MTVRQWSVGVGGALLLNVLAGLECLSFAGTREADQQQLALGRDLYAAHCGGCHGADLEGQPNWHARLPDGRLPAPPLDATGHAHHHSDEELFRVVKEGMEGVSPGRPSDMPAFAEILSNEEISAVISFIKTSW